MKKHTVKYTDEPLGKIRLVNDFLPKPEELVFKEDTVKITLTLTKSSVDFFKEEAGAYHTPYQQMIRALLDRYAAHYVAHRK